MVILRIVEEPQPLAVWVQQVEDGDGAKPQLLVEVLAGPIAIVPILLTNIDCDKRVSVWEGVAGVRSRSGILGHLRMGSSELGGQDQRAMARAGEARNHLGCTFSLLEDWFVARLHQDDLASVVGMND